jgi:hypothetical protein
MTRAFQFPARSLGHTGIQITPVGLRTVPPG